MLNIFSKVLCLSYLILGIHKFPGMFRSFERFPKMFPLFEDAGAADANNLSSDKIETPK